MSRRAFKNSTQILSIEELTQTYPNCWANTHIRQRTVTSPTDDCCLEVKTGLLSTGGVLLPMKVAHCISQLEFLTKSPVDDYQGAFS